MPGATRLASRCFHPVSKALAKLVAPTSDRLICHGYTALEEQFLDVAQTQLETEIPSNSAADDTSRETVPVIKRFRFFHRAILRDRPNNLTMPPRGSCTTLRWEKALQASPETLLRQNFCPNWLLECDPFVHLKAGPSLRGRSLGCPPACGVDPYQRTHRTMTSRSK